MIQASGLHPPPGGFRRGNVQSRSVRRQRRRLRQRARQLRRPRLRRGSVVPFRGSEARPRERIVDVARDGRDGLERLVDASLVRPPTPGHPRVFFRRARFFVKPRPGGAVRFAGFRAGHGHRRGPTTRVARKPGRRWRRRTGPAPVLPPSPLPRAAPAAAAAPKRTPAAAAVPTSPRRRSERRIARRDGRRRRP